MLEGQIKPDGGGIWERHKIGTHLTENDGDMMRDRQCPQVRAPS